MKAINWSFAKSGDVFEWCEVWYRKFWTDFEKKKVIYFFSTLYVTECKIMWKSFCRNVLSAVEIPYYLKYKMPLNLRCIWGLGKKIRRVHIPWIQDAPQFFSRKKCVKCAYIWSNTVLINSMWIPCACVNMGTDIFSEQKANEVNKTMLVSHSFKDPVASKWSSVQQPLDHRCVPEQVALILGS
jgi:hypothetical protein